MPMNVYLHAISGCDQVKSKNAAGKTKFMADPQTEKRDIPTRMMACKGCESIRLFLHRKDDFFFPFCFLSLFSRVIAWYNAHVSREMGSSQLILCRMPK